MIELAKPCPHLKASAVATACDLQITEASYTCLAGPGKTYII
jgi:hypothetical protein